MAKRTLQLTETEMAQFRQAEPQPEDERELKRLQAICLYGSGVSLTTIMGFVGAGESTIR